ncbi:Extracellular solute-binding protein, family 7 [Spirochaeta thermophila DSM 6578]|uniref:Extracellular solute-binding protein, family 7 n=1 Tax=Winmispira thermophila (strain ATCC 700085 / DSM 6578 / Z-1203) TaxID=869211 RepID=G0GA71_WINT7|nr:TRAP transporter substrate-binding protein [Spirochaeta thermophila]AEJ60907.1 Extracellular solute-binding protein, family 7 [Spirochaeta thermophila DSM 6578]
MKRQSILVPVLVLLMSCATTSQSGEEPAPASHTITIKVVNAFAPQNIMSLTADRFKEVLERDGGGRFLVQILDVERTEEKANELCSSGAAHLQFTGGYPLQVFAPEYSFFNAPYVMKDFAHFTRVWNGPLGDAARRMVAEKGNMLWIGNVYRGFRQTTANKPIYSVEDVQGLRLRLPGVQTWVTVWKAMGADPVTVPLSGLYDSLKTGKAEASEGDIPQIHSYKLYEVQKYLIITNHLVQTGGVLINKPFCESLSEADRKAVWDAAVEAIEWATNKVMSEEGMLLVDLQKKGMQVIIPDAASFREKGKTAVEELFRTLWSVTTWEEVLSQ